tara:strand:- start:104186 stop:104893 length:708 start_codon:yes stop_codon:yes gene_type:complete
MTSDMTSNIKSGMSSEDYTALLCSLPHLVNPFKYQSQSISLVQLQKRMNMLSYDDYVWLNKLRQLFYWGGISLDQDEAVLVKQAQRFMDELNNDNIKSWLLWRMDIRSIISAMRRRKQGQSAPKGTLWAYGNYINHIENNWSSPCFKLENRYPFLPEIEKHLKAGESFELECCLLKAVWHFYSTRQPENEYSFAAVILYLMKWDLIDRWRQYDTELGAQRFSQLVQECLPTELEI